MKKLIFLIFAITFLIATSCNSKDNSDIRESYISPLETYIEVLADQESYSIEIQSNTDWNATSNEEWITILTPTGNAGVSELQFSVAQLEEKSSREGQILVTGTSSNTSTTIRIKQVPFSADCKEIHYTTNYSEKLEIGENCFNTPIISHEFSGKKGIIKCKGVITSINDEAFYECQTLQSIILPESIESIGGWAFCNCIALKNVNFTERLTHIGSAAFASCEQLSEIVIPNGIEEIEESAFFGCSGLSRIAGKYASTDERCLVIDNVLIQFAPAGIDSYTIPSDIVAIKNDAFYNSTSLKSITIPSSVQSIGDYAFLYCFNLQDIYCEPTTPPTLGEMVFDNEDNGNITPIGCTIHVPTQSVEAYKTATNWDIYKEYIKGYDY